MNSVETSSEDFENEQAEIVNIIKSKEQRSEYDGTKFKWNKFNEDLACRVVKEFLKKHLPKQVKVVGPNAYIEGYPNEFDLLLVTENAIPAAFTNAYRNTDVRFVIEVKSHGYTDQERPPKLLSEFEDIRKRYRNVNCTSLTISETLEPKRDGSSYFRDLKDALGPRYEAFCLADSRIQELIPGQWKQFVSHVTENGARQA